MQLLERLRNEQDPVRSRALTALAAVPPRLVEASAVDGLMTVFGDALAARDASMATRSAVQRAALGVLVTHATDPALVQPSLLWLEAIFGDDRLPYLGRLELRRGQEVQTVGGPGMDRQRSAPQQVCAAARLHGGARTAGVRAGGAR